MKYILLSILLLASCTSQQEQETQQQKGKEENKVQLTAVQYKNAGVDTGHASREHIASVIRLTGTIDVPPQNMVSVSFPLGGYLKSTKLLPGMHISKGEVIAILEDQQYIQLQQDYLTAQARQPYLENEYRRQKELNVSKASSDKVFQQAEAEYKSNRILLSGLYQKLQLIGVNPDKLNETNISRTVSIHAPIDGFVSAVNVNIGKYVTPSDVLFELVNPSDIHLALTVFEKDVNALYIGQKLMAYSNNNPDKKYPCEIILIGKDVSATDRSVQVHCHFEEYDHSLIPGMYMNADVVTASDEQFAVPEDAVVRYGNKQYLFTAGNGLNFEMKEVITGPIQDGKIAIVNAPGMDLHKQPIVTRNAYALLMKLKNTNDEE